MKTPMTSGIVRTFRDLEPGETYLEYEGSTITIPIRAKLPKGWAEERLKLRAFMRLEVFPAYVNGLGTREFQFLIRDWELFGHSPLLNELFMGDRRGYVDPAAETRRVEHAVMTFRVAHHYEKSGDDGNENLAPARTLEIDDITHHDHDGHGNLYWHIEQDSRKKGAFVVRFFRSVPPKIKSPIDERNLDVAFDMVAKADGLAPGKSFMASAAGNSRMTVASRGNTALNRNLQLRTPMTVSWQLGKNPQPGATGRVHIVSPSRSFCIAAHGPAPERPVFSADFPARITYAINYDIFINNVRFVEDQAGVAIADGIEAIPPRDVLVAFEKPQSGAILGRQLEFDAGSCTGMVEISESEYREGKDMARYWRSNRLDVQSGAPPPPVPG